MIRRRDRFLLLLSAALALAAFAAAPARADSNWRWTGVDRVVAFGDVHGAYRELVALLQRAGVVDPSLHWSGGATHLVSLGDLVDRGPDSRAVLDLLMRLEDEAPKVGGVVHVVLGNHEVMNLTGDLRYVSEADYASVRRPVPPPRRRPARSNDNRRSPQPDDTVRGCCGSRR